VKWLKEGNYVTVGISGDLGLGSMSAGA
jgi:hypothetical protein